MDQMKSIFFTSAALLMSIGIACAQTSGSTSSSASTTTSGAANGSTKAGMMSMSQIKNKLKAEGYTNLTHIKKQNNRYTAHALRYGRQENNVQINAKTGQVENQSSLTILQAKNLLVKQGYKDVTNVKKNGKVITAKAKQNGQEKRIYVNDKTGVITPEK
jgi:hypothetical protein